MNRLLLIASVLAAFTACVHVFVGTPEIAAPLLKSSILPEVRFLLYACWHLVSFALVLSAIALFISSLPAYHQAPSLLPLFISSLWLSFGIVFLVVGIFGAHGTLFFKLPQWILLIPVSILGFFGCSRSRMRR